MKYSLVLAFLWVIAAAGIAALPSRHHHWPAAYGLIAIGIPILGFVTYEHGPIAGMLVFAGGASVLRWPLYFLLRWLRRQMSGRAE